MEELQARRGARRDEDDRLRILLLCNYDVSNAATVCDHINSFVRHSRHSISVVSKLGALSPQIDFDQFDVIVIHYSLTLSIDAYVAPNTRHRLAAFRGLKVLFIQDEYRFVERTEEAIRKCGIGLVYTVLPQEIVPKVYDLDSLPGVRFVTTLTGYVPDWLKIYSTIPLAQRHFDVGYRGRSYPAWHGRPGIERIEIGRVFEARARSLGLKVNIRWGEGDRLYGAAWVEFTRQCRAVLATESSIAVIDRKGAISNRYDAFVDLLGIRQPDRGASSRSLKALGLKGPDARKGWFEELRRRFFSDAEGKVVISVISPRVFEAAALRSLLVMYEGHYSGILTPWRHYLPLKKDHSNIGEIAAFIKDDVRCAEVISNCFAEIACDPRYAASTFISGFDDTVEAEMAGYVKSAVPVLDVAAILDAAPFNMVENPHGVAAGLVSGRVTRWVRRKLGSPTPLGAFLRAAKRMVRRR